MRMIFKILIFPKRCLGVLLDMFFDACWEAEQYWKRKGF